MASSLAAPWLTLLFDEVDDANEVASGTQSGSTERWKKVIDDALLPAGMTTELMAEAAKAPLVFVVPIGKGKVALLHHLVLAEEEKGKTWVGLAGFGACAPWRTLDENYVKDGLVGPSVSGSIKDQALPSTNQFLELKSQDGVKALKGKTKEGGGKDESVDTLKGTSLVQVLEPSVLAYLKMGGRTSVPAAEVLLSIMEYLKGVTEWADKEAGPEWETILRRLWVVAKEFTTIAKLGYPPEGDDELDRHCIKVLQAFSRATPQDEGSLSPAKKRKTVGTSSPGGILRAKQLESGSTLPKKRKAQAKVPDDSPRKYKAYKGKSKIGTILEDPIPRKVRKEAEDWTGGPQEPAASPSKGRERKEDKEGPGNSPDEESSDSEPSTDAEDDSPRKRKFERGKANNVPPSKNPEEDSSGPDSSESSDGNNPSDDGTDRSPLGRTRRDKGSLSLLTETISRAVDQMAIYQKEKVETEKKKSTLLTAWTDDALDLFKVLSARSWNDVGIPELNEFVRETIRDKKPNRAINRIEQAGRRWDGLPSQNGMIEFFSRGFLAQDVLEEPGGFTVFMCQPRDHIAQRTDMEKKQAYQDIFGSGELSDETLKAFVKKDWFVPADRYEAMEQLSVGISFLDLLTSNRGIASVGLRHGLRLLKENSTIVKAELRRDKLFLWKYQHLMDAVFQRFCERLNRLSHLREPLREAKRDRLDRFQVEMIDGALGNFFELGHTPALSLPGSIERFAARGRDKTKSPNQEQKKGEEGEKTPKKATSSPKENTATKKVGWHVANPSRETAWSLPEGVDFNSLFGKGMFENQKGFPKFKHHAGTGDAVMCLRYQILGKCHGGKECRGAHVPTDKMKTDDKAAVDARIRELYKS